MQSSGLSSDDCQTSVIMRHKEPKHKEPSTPDLLNDSANVRTTVEKNRPRSCVNPTTIGYDVCPNNSRIEIENNRRWSGVHLGSKLMQAFDRLVFDDSDDYTDSLENNKPPSAKPSSNEVKVTWRCFVWYLNVMCFDNILLRSTLLLITGILSTCLLLLTFIFCAYFSLFFTSSFRMACKVFVSTFMLLLKSLDWYFFVYKTYT